MDKDNSNISAIIKIIIAKNDINQTEIETLINHFKRDSEAIQLIEDIETYRIVTAHLEKNHPAYINSHQKMVERCKLLLEKLNA